MVARATLMHKERPLHISKVATYGRQSDLDAQRATSTHFGHVRHLTKSEKDGFQSDLFI
jgi:hypothetical protein